MKESVYLAGLLILYLFFPFSVLLIWRWCPGYIGINYQVALQILGDIAKMCGTMLAIFATFIVYLMREKGSILDYKKASMIVMTCFYLLLDIFWSFFVMIDIGELETEIATQASQIFPFFVDRISVYFAFLWLIGGTVVLFLFIYVTITSTKNEKKE